VQELTMPCHAIAGEIATSTGVVPRVTTSWAWRDRLGACKVRLNIGRMRYGVPPGLYAVGQPGPESPVLATANYKLTFDHLRCALAGIDAWILVLDTKGINVWCAAGKKTFGTDELVRRRGCKVTVSLMARSRIWQLIESGALDFSLSGITDAERDKFAAFAWYFSNKYYLLVRKDFGVLNQADIAKNDKLQLGVIRAFRYSESANRLVDKLHDENRVSQAGGLEPLYQALMENKIQGMIIEPFDYPVLSENKIRDISTIVEFNDPPVLHGLIMSKKSLSTAEQDKWRSLINTMRTDGTLLRIFETYFKPELAAALVNFQ